MSWLLKANQNDIDQSLRLIVVLQNKISSFMNSSQFKNLCIVINNASEVAVQLESNEFISNLNQLTGQMEMLSNTVCQLFYHLFLAQGETITSSIPGKLK
jgi:hypothetical protein